MKKSGVFIFVFTFFVVICALSLRSEYINFSHKIFGKTTKKIDILTQNVSSFFKKDALLEENERLRIKLAEKNSYEEENKLIKQENENLKKLLSVKETTSFKKMRAVNVVGLNTLGDFFITVDCGKNDGVSEGDVAVWGKTLVGRVSEVFEEFSYVVPITAPDVCVGIINENEDAGIISGAPSLYKDNMCKISFFSNTAKLSDGDTVFTSGLSDNYPLGLVIGKVKIKNGEAYVKTEADFFKIRALHILTPE